MRKIEYDIYFEFGAEESYKAQVFDVLSDLDYSNGGTKLGGILIVAAELTRSVVTINSYNHTAKFTYVGV